MSESKKYGAVWQDDELDAIVADYFDMLMSDLGGHPYIKSRHSAALMAKIERSHRSVEFKHQNISAVLDKLGLPWIPGYIPKSNYQKSILTAIERYLSVHTGLFEIPPRAPEPVVTLSAVFVTAPPLRDEEEIPPALRRLVRKFDPIERDQRNRALGKAGEAFVLNVERARLQQADRSDLAGRVRWVAVEDGDGAGFDILSFTAGGSERLIEVKTTNGTARTPFILTRNELGLSIERPADWIVYRVHDFVRTPQIFCISPPIENTVRLRPDSWRASF